MSRSRSLLTESIIVAAASAAMTGLAAPALADVYTDAQGDQYSPNAYVDIANVVTTNDASNITFQINLNPSANILDPAGGQIYGKYQIGFQVNAASGSTALMNPWGNPIGISSGMDFWLGGWADNSSTPPFSGYAQLYHWNGSTSAWDLIAGGSSNPFVDTPTTLDATSFTVSMPLASLGLSNGSNVKFDVYTTYGNPGGQSAYDALNKPTLTTDPGVPWEGAPYDSGTLLSQYTVSIGVVTGSSWNVDADGNWSTAGNWSGGVPNAVGATATFGTIITAPRTVSVDSSQTIGSIVFAGANSYTIAGASTLTLDTSSGPAGINVGSGTHAISAPVVLNKDLTITSAAGAGVALSGNLTATGRTITKAGAGSAQFANVRAAALNVSEGSAQISAKGTPNSAAGTSVVGSLSIAAGASLDLTNNSAVIDYTAPVGTLVADVRQHLQTGRLTTSNGDASHRLGYGDNAVLNKSSFAGQTVDTSSVLIKFTYGGDANLDGQVDVTDLGSLATNWQTSNVWTGGDFNYDGFVDVTDLGALATNWQAGVGSPLGRKSFQDALAGVGLGGVSVPEPGSIVLFLAPLMLASRRRRLRRPE